MIEEITGFVCWVQFELQSDVNQTFGVLVWWNVHFVFFTVKVRLVIGGGESWWKIWQNYPSRTERNRRVWHRVFNLDGLSNHQRCVLVCVCMAKCLSWGNHVTPPPIEIRGCVAPQDDMYVHGMLECSELYHASVSVGCGQTNTKEHKYILVPYPTLPWTCDKCQCVIHNVMLQYFLGLFFSYGGSLWLWFFNEGKVYLNIYGY